MLLTRFSHRQQAEEIQPLRPLAEPLWLLAGPPGSHARARKRQKGLLRLQRRRATSKPVGEGSGQELVPVPPVLRRRGADMPPRLHSPGKLGSRRGVNSLGGLTYLTDSLSGTRFLVDTGAAVSVLPYNGTKPVSPTVGRPSLAGADGTCIKSWEKYTNRSPSADASSRMFYSSKPQSTNLYWVPIFSPNINSWWTQLATESFTQQRCCRSAHPPAVMVLASSPHCPPCRRLSPRSWRNFPA